MPILITDELARRLEYAEALDGSDCADACLRADPGCGAAVKAVAGGFCLFCGEASPLTHALYMGLTGPVSAEQLREIEDFFRSRGAPVTIDVSPHADPALRDLLSERRYRMSDFNNVLVRRVEPEMALPPPPPGVTVREAEASESELYARTAIAGFLTRDDLTEEELRLGRTLHAMNYSTPMLALVDGQVAGACGMSIRAGVASFFADSTLPAFRGRGVHAATIAERLRRAAAAGCEYATAGTQPGSGSQRNYQRLGFEVAYSKVTMTLPRS